MKTMWIGRGSFSTPYLELDVRLCTAYKVECVTVKQIENPDVAIMSPAFLALFLLLAVNSAQSVPENEVLVLLDNLAVRETHSIFFKSLNGMSKKLASYVTCPISDRCPCTIFRARLQAYLQAR